MSKPEQWLINFYTGGTVVEGLVAVQGYDRADQPPEEVTVMEKAAHYGADAVFFEGSRDNKPRIPQAFIYRSSGPAIDPDFAEIHKQLWSWGGVPLVYRATSGLVQLFRCSHRPDFEKNRATVFKPFKTLRFATQIANDPWWNDDRLRNGTLWDDPAVCKDLLSSNQSAQKTLIKAVKELYDDLEAKAILTKPLCRRLLILSVLIAYLEARRVFEDGFFARFLLGADRFFQVLADGSALLALLEHLEERFNGNVFVLSNEERETLRSSDGLTTFAELVEGRQEASGQRTLWQRYSFADLPVELISHIYQLFVKDASVAVYTPHFVVRLMLGEVLSWERLDRLQKNDEVIMDGACGSGIFLVEAYKRLVLHWRYRNEWKRPSKTILQNLLTKRLRGIDLEEGAVELAAFSLCLALCDALEPMEIRTSVRLFPELKEKTIHSGCFFEARERETIKDKVGVAVGNPPFSSTLTTDGAKKAYDRYQRNHGALPDKQLAYLFLHESMEMLVSGGILSMLQQYNFLYNQKSLGFRRKFVERWDVREILDFISVRGLFHKGGADTKVLVVVAEAETAPPDRKILHATFRRSGRVDAEQGFDIDYYDMNWLPRTLVAENDGVWRSDLLGGGRVLGFVDRLKNLTTLGSYADTQNWDHGEGFVEGASGISRPATHIVGKPLLPSESITRSGIDRAAITTAQNKPIEGPRSPRRFTPPMLLIREHMDLFRGVWTDSYLTYKNKVVGFSGSSQKDTIQLRGIDEWIGKEITALQAYVAVTSLRLFTQKATTLSGADIENLPYPLNENLDLSPHEQILVSDIVDYYRDLVRLGEDSLAMKESGTLALPTFNDIFVGRINGVYRKKKLRALKPQIWPGVICQPYFFGEGDVDWSGADELEGKVDALLREKQGGGLSVTRIARVYDGASLYLLKPDRLRYWLGSIALRDSDEVLADLAKQGF
jgi:hypothetical protein